MNELIEGYLRITSDGEQDAQMGVTEIDEFLKQNFLFLHKELSQIELILKFPKVFLL